MREARPVWVIVEERWGCLSTFDPQGIEAPQFTWRSTAALFFRTEQQAREVA